MCRLRWGFDIQSGIVEGYFLWALQPKLYSRIMITDGPYFTRTLDALDLQGSQRDRHRSERVQHRQCSDGLLRSSARHGCGGGSRSQYARPTGLVYGRIQSGKTRAMIADTAMAFDNGFRISVVMTSNINDLVAQTHVDFS